MKKSEDTTTAVTEQFEVKSLTTRPESLVAKRKLTMDATSIARLGQLVCRVDGEMEVIEMPPVAKGQSSSHAQALPIYDLVRNQPYLLICNAIIVSAMARSGAPLTGKYFAMRAGEITAGKRYRHVDVTELEPAQ